MAKPRMNETQVRKSLADWEKRQHFRYGEWRFYRDHDHTHGPKSRRLSPAERKKLTAKWQKLAHEADYWVARRRTELRWYIDHQPVQHRARAVERALAFSKMGIVEKPAGSNSGPYITAWQKATAGGGSWLYHAPWCGIFVENICRHEGVKTSSRWAAVAFIEDDAKAHHNGLRGWTRDPHAVQRGDLVVMFGRGVHVEMVIEVHPTYIVTVGGNTSAGNTGSQANGGGCYRRVRSLASVWGFALVDYPG